MAINIKYIKSLTTLAKISVSEQVLESTVKQIDEVMAIISEIKNIEIEQKVRAEGERQLQQLRQDVISEQIDIQKLQQNSEYIQDQFFVVPQVVE